LLSGAGSRNHAAVFRRLTVVTVKRGDPPTDIRWRNDPALWLCGVIIAVVIVVAALLATHHPSAKIDCIPGYHVHHETCVRDPLPSSPRN